MVSKGTSLSLAIVYLIVDIGWNWVGLLLPDDHRGTELLSNLRKNMEKIVCIDFVEMISSTWNSFSFTFWANLGKIQESLANIIIIYGDSVSLHGLMLNLVKQFLTWKVWVMNSQWDATHHADYVLVDSFH